MLIENSNQGHGALYLNPRVNRLPDWFVRQ